MRTPGAFRTGFDNLLSSLVMPGPNRNHPVRRLRASPILLSWATAALIGMSHAAGCGGEDDESGTPEADAGVETRPGEAEDAGGTPDADAQEQPAPGEPGGPRTPTREAIGERRFSRTRYLSDLERIAKERPPGSEHWQVVQDLCASRLSELGYDVRREAYGTGTNVFGIQGGLSRPEEQVILGAHYDHIPGCSGADDNATGVAGALEIARLLEGVAHDRTLVIACWDEEEVGLKGSANHAMALAEEGIEVALAVSLEMIGYASQAQNSQQVPAGFEVVFPEAVETVTNNGLRGDFIALIGNSQSAATMAAFDTAAEAVQLKTVVLEANATFGPVLLSLLRSDHASYWLAGWPAIMVTDTANFRNPYYHCQQGDDTIERLNLGFAGQVVDAAAAAVQEALQRE